MSRPTVEEECKKCGGTFLKLLGRPEELCNNCVGVGGETK